MQHKSFLAVLAALAVSYLCISTPASATAQSTAFTYQGNLNASGTPATGTYQFTFTLFDAATSGTQIGAPIQQSIDVVNGLFTTDLDFGSVFVGQQYWLEVRVGTTLVTEQTLAGRQPVNAVPVAQYALDSPAGAGPTLLHHSGNAPNRTSANSIALATVNGIAYTLQCWFNTNTNQLIEELDVNSPVAYDVHEMPIAKNDSAAPGGPQFLNATNFYSAQLWSNVVDSGGHQEELHMPLVIDLHTAREQVQQGHIYMRATTTGFGGAANNNCDIEAEIVATTN